MTSQEKTFPKRIYKYQPASIQAVANLSAGKLWFADPFNFNDPYDCAIELIRDEVEKGLARLDAASCLEMLMHLNTDNTGTLGTQLSQLSLSRLKELARDTVLKNLWQIDRGVCCFSTRKDNLLMWGHYADCHRGFCLEFTTEFNPFNDPRRLRHVNYRADYPKLDEIRLKNHDYLHLLDFLLSKSRYWKYEKEMRLLHIEKNKPLSYERQCLKAIYIGAKTPEDTALLIAHTAANTDTKIYRARIDMKKFKLNFELQTCKWFDYRASKPL